MIPLQLTLKNFLSYRSARLDFRGLHVACICGANGAGKSSLLEAIAWAIWGQSRAVTEDDVIHQGEVEAQVDFVFRYHQHTYRVLRTRYRGQTSGLEFQVETPNGFRSLTERGMRATQQLILHHLRLDYDTFVNSAYLRQGRADELMLKRPSERKQILADLLKLNQYDELAEQARERSRQFKAEASVLERNLETLSEQLYHRSALDTEKAAVLAQIEDLRRSQAQDQVSLQHLQAQQQEYQTRHHQLTLQQQQHQHLAVEVQRLQQEQATAQVQLQQLQAILAEATAIATGFAQFQSLQTEEEHQSTQFQAHQAAIAQRDQLLRQLQETERELQDQIRQVNVEWATLEQQEQELHHALRKREDVEAGLVQLQQARARLTELDRVQLQVAPLMQRRQQLQTQLDRAQTRLSARLEELRSLSQTLQTQQQQQPRLQQKATEIAQRVDYLEQRRLYQQKVREKGTERRNFLERLQERQRDCEQQLAELDHKIQLLKKEVRLEAAIARVAESPGSEFAVSDVGASLEFGENKSALVQFPTPYPPCPLCDRPLDEDHWHLVLAKHQAERQAILRQIWVIREQLTTSEREIKVLRQEYRDLEKELAEYNSTLEHRGQLQQQLQAALEGQQRLQSVLQEQDDLTRSLHLQTYAPELLDELQQLDHSLQALNYDEKDHALARGEVDRWRWAEIKQAELRQAQRRLEQITERKPHLQAERTALEAQLNQLHHSPLQQQITQLNHQIQAIAYDINHHTAIRHALRQMQGWQLRHQELLQAQQRYPQIEQRVKDLSRLQTERSQIAQAIAEEIAQLQFALKQLPNIQTTLQTLEHQIQARRSQLESALAQLGRLEQQQQQLETLQHQKEEQEIQLQTLQRQHRVYHELAQAFSKNGIQALMIENVLPQLEAETNQILGRLSNHQLHVQFVTQRVGRKKGAKLIDTLDILIGNLQGTRPYETYSGGEAFRVNFAIRLALARLLAQRAGTPLQLLIIDEGFGTQDQAGCDRLISAINAIAPDFACILTVTHMPHLKEAFQTRIEVQKTDDGSQIQLLA